MKIREVFIYLTVVTIGFGICGNAYAAGIKAAVIAGVSDYRYINDLSYCAKDARDIYSRTVRMTNAKKSNIKLLAGKKATRNAIRNSIRTFGKRVKAGDVFMFYFSGHGSHGIDVPPFDDANLDDEYICPYDSRYDSNGYINYKSLIRDDQLYSWLLPITQKGATVLVILDTCYSGGALKAGAATLRPGVNIKVMDGTPLVKKSTTSGFSKDLNNPGFIVLTACDDEELSAETPWFQNGVFTHLLLRALDGVADDSWVIGGVGNDDGIITANELFHSATVDENVPYKESATTITQVFEQTPQIYGGASTEPLFYLK